MFVVGVVLVKDATEYWIASWKKTKVYKIIAIYGWCGPWKGSHWIMDLKRNVVIYVVRR